MVTFEIDKKIFSNLFKTIVFKDIAKLKFVSLEKGLGIISTDITCTVLFSLFIPKGYGDLKIYPDEYREVCFEVTKNVLSDFSKGKSEHVLFTITDNDYTIHSKTNPDSKLYDTVIPSSSPGTPYVDEKYTFSIEFSEEGKEKLFSRYAYSSCHYLPEIASGFSSVEVILEGKRLKVNAFSNNSQRKMNESVELLNEVSDCVSCVVDYDIYSRVQKVCEACDLLDVLVSQDTAFIVRRYSDSGKIQNFYLIASKVE